MALVHERSRAPRDLGVRLLHEPVAPVVGRSSLSSHREEAIEHRRPTGAIRCGSSSRPPLAAGSAERTRRSERTQCPSLLSFWNSGLKCLQLVLGIDVDPLLEQGEGDPLVRSAEGDDLVDVVLSPLVPLRDRSRWIASRTSKPPIECAMMFTVGFAPAALLRRERTHEVDQARREPARRSGSCARRGRSSGRPTASAADPRSCRRRCSAVPGSMTILYLEASSRRLRRPGEEALVEVLELGRNLGRPRRRACRSSRSRSSRPGTASPTS